MHAFDTIHPAQVLTGRSLRRWGSTTRWTPVWTRLTTWTASSFAPTSSGTVGARVTFPTNNLEIVETFFSVRVPSEAGGSPPQAWYCHGDEQDGRHLNFIQRLVMQVNTDVLDTVLLSLHPAEVNTDKKVPTRVSIKISLRLYVWF